MDIIFNSNNFVSLKLISKECRDYVKNFISDRNYIWQQLWYSKYVDEAWKLLFKSGSASAELVMDKVFPAQTVSLIFSEELFVFCDRLTLNPSLSLSNISRGVFVWEPVRVYPFVWRGLSPVTLFCDIYQPHWRPLSSLKLINCSRLFNNKLWIKS